MPHAGGQYVFLREAYGRPVGFLFGWSTFLVVQTGTIAAVAVAFAKFLGVFLPGVAEDHYPLLRPLILGRSGFALSLSTQQIVAIAVIVGLTIVNTRGLKTGTLVQNTLTITKMAALLGLVLLGLTLGIRRSGAAFTSSWWHPAANGWSPANVEPGLGAVGGIALMLLLGKAMIGPLFSQTAWNNVTFTGGETRDPQRTLPRALILGCTSVVVLYVLANIAYVLTLPLSAIQNAPNDRVGTATMEAILGPAGLVVMTVAILISTFGCNNGIILAGARVYYAMARDGLFFQRVGAVNRRHVPAVALIAQGLWAVFLTLPRTVTWTPAGEPLFGNAYSKLLEYVTATDLTFASLMVAAVIVLRFRRRAVDRPFGTPGYPIPPLVFLVLAVLLLADFIYLNPATSGTGFLIVLTGVPVYVVWSRWARRGVLPTPSPLAGEGWGEGDSRVARAMSTPPHPNPPPPGGREPEGDRKADSL